MNTKTRLERLEFSIKPAGSWAERTPFAEKIAAWRAARDAGLYLDFSNGRAVDLERLRQSDPARVDRLENIMMNDDPMNA